MSGRFSLGYLEQYPDEALAGFVPVAPVGIDDFRLVAEEDSQSLGIAGVEVGFDVSQFTKGIKPRLIPGIQVEAPVGRFSFGAGLGREIGTQQCANGGFEVG